MTVFSLKDNNAKYDHELHVAHADYVYFGMLLNEKRHIEEASRNQLELHATYPGTGCPARDHLSLSVAM
jgi:hypothetical protein